MLAFVIPRSSNCSRVSAFSTTDTRTCMMPSRSAGVASRKTMSFLVTFCMLKANRLETAAGEGHRNAAPVPDDCYIMNW
jgi:hypothetical protein